MRISGGHYKGRKLIVPEGVAVRPTSERMRQTLFNMLHHAKWVEGFKIRGAQVMDIFCGSGSLGLEALSHGAAHCAFVDTDTLSINKNAAFLEPHFYTIIRGDVTRLAGIKHPASLVLMDPPYHQDLAVPTLMNLCNKNMIADQAIIVIETEKSHPNFDGFEQLDKRIQSQSALHILRYHEQTHD